MFSRLLAVFTAAAGIDLVLSSVNLEIGLTSHNGGKPAPGEQSIISITPYDAIGNKIEWATLYPEHERRLHVIITSHSLEFFAHIHPEDYSKFNPGAVGPFSVNQTLPYAGLYVVIAEMALLLGTEGCESLIPETKTFTKAAVFEVGNHTQSQAPKAKGDELEVLEAALDESGLPIADVRGSTISVKPDVAGGSYPLFQEQCISIRLSFTKKGADFKGLRPYLGAVGHITLIPLDWDGIDASVQHLHASTTPPIVPCSSGSMHHAINIPDSFGPDVFFDIRIPNDGQYALFFETMTFESYLVMKLCLDIKPLKLDITESTLTTGSYEITWPEEMIPVSPLAIFHVPPSRGGLEEEVIHDEASYVLASKFSPPAIVQALFITPRAKSAAATNVPILLSTFISPRQPGKHSYPLPEIPLMNNDPFKAFELASGKIKSGGAEYRILVSLNDGMNAFVSSCVKFSAKLIVIEDGHQTTISFQNSPATQSLHGPRLMIIGEKIRTVPLLSESLALRQKLEELDDRCSAFHNGEALNMSHDSETSQNILGFFKVGNENNITIYFQATILDESMMISREIVEAFRINLCQTGSTLLWEDPCTWSIPPAAGRDVNIPSSYHVEMIGDKLRQVEMKTLVIRGKLSIYGRIDVLAERILVLDGGHLDVKRGPVNFILTDNAFGNPFCFNSKLEEAGNSIIIRGGYFTANWENDSYSSPLLIGIVKKTQERGSEVLFIAHSGIGEIREIHHAFQGSVWFRDVTMQQLEFRVVRAERDAEITDSDTWKLTLESPLPHNVPQGSIFAQKEDQYMISIKRQNPWGNSYPLLILKSPQSSIDEINSCGGLDSLHSLDVAAKAGRRQLLHSDSRSVGPPSNTVFKASIAGAGVLRSYKVASFFKEAESTFRGRFLFFKRSGSSTAPSWPAILLVGNKIDFEGHNILIERPSGPCILAKGDIHFSGKTILCALSSSNGIEIDLAGSTTPSAIFSLTSTVIVGNKGRGILIEGAESFQVNIDSCVSSWNNGPGYEWRSPLGRSQNAKSSVFKNCQSLYSGDRDTILRDNSSLHKGSKKYKARGAKPYAQASAARNTQLATHTATLNKKMIRIQPLVSYLESDDVGENSTGIRTTVAGRTLAFFAIDTVKEFAAIAIKFKILSKGAIVVGLNAFGGIPYLPGFDVDDHRTSQIRSPKRPFDFAKVIDAEGSSKEIVWTNPVYNTGIWYLAIGGKDGIAADFEVKVVIRGQCLPSYVPYWTENPMTKDNFYLCKAFLVEIPPNTMSLYVEVVRKMKPDQIMNGGGTIIFKARRNTLPLMKGVDQALFSVEGIFRGEVPEGVFDSPRFASRITAPPGQYYLQVFFVSQDDDTATVDIFVGVNTCAAGSSIIPVFTPSHHPEDFVRDAKEIPLCKACQAIVNKLEPGIIFAREKSYESESTKGRFAHMDLFQISVPKYSQGLSVNLSDVTAAVILHFKHETLPLQVDSEDYLSFLDDYSFTIYPGNHEIVSLDAFHMGGRHGDWYLSLEFTSSPGALSYKILADVREGPLCLGNPKCLGKGLCRSAPSQQPCACVDAYEGEFCSRVKPNSALSSRDVDDVRSHETLRYTTASVERLDSVSDKVAQRAANLKNEVDHGKRSV